MKSASVILLLLVYTVGCSPVFPQIVNEPPCQMNPDLQCNCTTAGFFSYPNDPTMYVQCSIVGGSWAFYAYTCPLDSEFEQALNRCVMISGLGNAP